MIDAYEKLFESYPKEKFFQDSISSIIFVPDKKIEKNWEEQKNKLNHGGEFFIRGYGRDGDGTVGLIEFYKHLFPAITVKRDPNNNAIPTRLLSEYTGLSKILTVETKDRQRIQNYQVSHLFGRTKNPILFSAAWNFAYIPKYLDPFTGHESQGIFQKEFQKLFDELLWDKFGSYIDDYNNLFENQIDGMLLHAYESTKETLSQNNVKISPHFWDRFFKDVKEELEPIIKR